MRSSTTYAAQNFAARSRALVNAGQKSAAVIPPVEPHKCREETRICVNRRGETYKVTWRH